MNVQARVWLSVGRPGQALRFFALRGVTDADCDWRRWCSLLRDSPSGRIVLIRSPVH